MISDVCHHSIECCRREIFWYKYTTLHKWVSIFEFDTFSVKFTAIFQVSPKLFFFLKKINKLKYFKLILKYLSKMSIINIGMSVAQKVLFWPIYLPFFSWACLVLVVGIWLHSLTSACCSSLRLWHLHKFSMELRSGQRMFLSDFHC